MRTKTLKDDWWQHACDESPEATAFVCKDDVFLWTNHAWSVLTGYPASALVGEKRWQDITALDDVGTDQASAESVRNGEQDRYYFLKTYRRPDQTTVNVGILVIRHPPHGPQEGFLVFARETVGKEYVELKELFANIDRRVRAIAASQDELVGVPADLIRTRQELAGRIEQNATTITAMVGGQSGGVHIGGNAAAGDNVGRDKNSTWMIAWVLTCLLLVAAAVTGTKVYLDATRVEVHPTASPVTGAD